LKVAEGAYIYGDSRFYNVQAGNKKVRVGSVPESVEGAAALDNKDTTSDSAAGDNVAKIIVDNGKDNYVYGGKKDDTITAGAGDSVWGAGGNDLIKLGKTTETSEKVGLVNNSGRDTVTGFVAGFGENSDAVYFFNGNYMDLGATAIKDGKLTVQINGEKTSLTFDNDFSQTGAYMRIQDAAHHGDEAVNIAIGHGSKSDLPLGADVNGNWANVYYNGPVDFSKYEETNDLFIDMDKSLSGTTDSFYGFYGVNSVKGSDSVASKLAGNGANNNTLVGGASGNNSLWGGSGKGNDSLVGNDNSVDTFYFDTDCGNDTISGAGADDKVMFYNSPSTVLQKWDNDKKIATFSNGSTLTFDGIQAGFQAQFANGTHTYKEDGTWDWQAKA